jgi:glycerophosphoryl diester phosphodiesterase
MSRALPTVEVIAHRGAGQRFVRPLAPPENTLPALRDGWSRTGACELDVHLTGDGAILVVHDDTTARTTDRDWVVANRTLAELRTLDAGAWKGQAWAGERLPTLAEVLDAMPDGKSLYVEIKTGPALVAPLADLLRDHPKRERVALISFDTDTIVAAKKTLPICRCYWILVFENEYANGCYNVQYDEGPHFKTRKRLARPQDLDELVAFVADSGLDGVDTSFIFPEGLLARLAARGLEAVAWTVDDPEVAVALAEKGVLRITTDDPDTIRVALAERGFPIR